MNVILQKHDDRRWPDIVQTEIRLLPNGSRGLCLLPEPRAQVGAARIPVLKKITKAIASKVRRFLDRQPSAAPAVSRTDLAEAYLHACLAAPFFSYVSPALYGLATVDDEQDVMGAESDRGDDL